MRTKIRTRYTVVALLAVLVLAAAAFGWFATRPSPTTQPSINEAEVDTPAPAQIEEGGTTWICRDADRALLDVEGWPQLKALKAHVEHSQREVPVKDREQE
jgi:hypothetical protein